MVNVILANSNMESLKSEFTCFEKVFQWNINRSKNIEYKKLRYLATYVAIKVLNLNVIYVADL